MCFRESPLHATIAFPRPPRRHTCAAAPPPSTRRFATSFAPPPRRISTFASLPPTLLHQLLAAPPRFRSSHRLQHCLSSTSSRLVRCSSPRFFRAFVSSFTHAENLPICSSLYSSPLLARINSARFASSALILIHPLFSDACRSCSYLWLAERF